MSVVLAQMVDGVVVHRFELSPGVTAIGRKPENDIVVQDTAVSGVHARFTVKPNPDFEDYIDVFVEDSGSTNGTFVNELPAELMHKLHHSDVVRIGFNEFKVLHDDNADMTRTMHIPNPS